MIRMIAKDLRINPLRTSLTALSMFIGIIALIAGVLVGTLGRDYLEAVNARLGGKSPTYSAIVDVPSSVNIQVVTALQERLAHFRPGIASAQYHLNDLAIWASSGDGNTEIRRVTIIITDAERTRIMPAPIIEGTWLTGADEPATLETAANESARQYVHDGTVALARTGNPQQVPARVNGVIADGTDTPTINVNATTLQRYWPQAWEPDGLTILVHPNEGVDDQHAKTVLDDLLSDVGTGSISSWNRSDNADDYEQVIGFLQLGVTVTAILLLSVSAIGMINIGLAGIEQRSHELLIRRALGTTREPAGPVREEDAHPPRTGRDQSQHSHTGHRLVRAARPHHRLRRGAHLRGAGLGNSVDDARRLAAGTARIPIYGGDDCGLCVHRHLACRLSCPGHQSHTAATRAGVAMNQKPFWTSPPTAGWSAFRSSIASGKQSACGMCTMVEMPQPQNVDY